MSATTLPEYSSEIRRIMSTIMERLSHANSQQHNVPTTNADLSQQQESISKTVIPPMTGIDALVQSHPQRRNSPTQTENVSSNPKKQGARRPTVRRDARKSALSKSTRPIEMSTGPSHTRNAPNDSDWTTGHNDIIGSSFKNRDHASPSQSSLSAALQNILNKSIPMGTSMPPPVSNTNTGNIRKKPRRVKSRASRVSTGQPNNLFARQQESVGCAAESGHYMSVMQSETYKEKVTRMRNAHSRNATKLMERLLQAQEVLNMKLGASILNVVNKLAYCMKVIYLDKDHKNASQEALNELETVDKYLTFTFSTEDLESIRPIARDPLPPDVAYVLKRAENMNNAYTNSLLSLNRIEAYDASKICAQEGSSSPDGGTERDAKCDIIDEGSKPPVMTCQDDIIPVSEVHNVFPQATPSLVAGQVDNSFVVNDNILFPKGSGIVGEAQKKLEGGESSKQLPEEDREPRNDLVVFGVASSRTAPEVDNDLMNTNCAGKETNPPGESFWEELLTSPQMVGEPAGEPLREQEKVVKNGADENYSGDGANISNFDKLLNELDW